VAERIASEKNEELVKQLDSIPMEKAGLALIRKEQEIRDQQQKLSEIAGLKAELKRKMETNPEKARREAETAKAEKLEQRRAQEVLEIRKNAERQKLNQV